ncbi:hypothetical protein K443DRAFT_6610 [Laccaria amethystina LaAM-08-1]|uniref:Uncharacterized protein n=1 Tax=Laccaria amethystina LaAM-08-1 TaxID=1095629 RepID=A0A0C9Y160_9AGAR|nr:hypothetical protein K443DRAFT_6610 [Laccaria amethystina LaAM-08-1]
MPSLSSLRNRFSVLSGDGYSSDDEAAIGVALSMHTPGRAATTPTEVTMHIPSAQVMRSLPCPG